MNKLRIVLSSAILLVYAHVCALVWISDRELSEIAGQAFITVDTSSYSDPTYGNFEFSKINLGVDIEIQAYDRSGLLRDITQVLSGSRTDVLSLNTATNAIPMLSFVFRSTEAAK